MLWSAIVATVTGSTPWWGTLVVAAVGFVGVLVSQWLTTRRDRERAEAERDERALERKTDAYASFVRAGRVLMVATEGLRGGLVPVEQADRLSTDLAHQAVVINFLAPKPVQLAVDQIFGEVGAITELRLNGTTRGPQYETAAKALGEAISAAAIAMAADLGVNVSPGMIRNQDPPTPTE